MRRFIPKRGKKYVKMAVRITLKVSLCVAGFHRLFVYACLISQSRGSIPYIGLGVETSGQCGCSVVRVGAIDVINAWILRQTAATWPGSL
jgi:hypothetical protein